MVDTIAAADVRASRPSAGDFAVMYRTNAQSRLLEEAFLRAGMPYRLVGAQRFYGRREVKDVIAYLRLVHNPADEISLARVINVPPRGIGDKTLAALQLAAQQAGITAGRGAARSGRNARRHPASGRSSRAAGRRCWPISARCWRTGRSWLRRCRCRRCSTASSRIPATRPTSRMAAKKATTAGRTCMELRRLAFEFQERG